MREQLIEIGTWIANGGLLIIFISIACYLLYKTVEAIKDKEFVYGLVFLILTIFSVSLSMVLFACVI